jgi:hypothetical protein
MIGHPMLSQYYITCLGIWASTDCAITFWRIVGEHRVNFPRTTLFGKPLSKAFISQILPGDSTEDDPLIPLIISRILSGDSTDDDP